MTGGQLSDLIGASLPAVFGILGTALGAWLTHRSASSERVRSEPGRFDRSVSRPLRQVFERAQASGNVRGDIAAARLTESLFGLIVALTTSTPQLGKEDIIATITDLFLDGARARGPRLP